MIRKQCLSGATVEECTSKVYFSVYKCNVATNNKATDDSPKTIASKLEVLIEKGSAAVSCNANRTKTVCKTVEHVNFFIKVCNNLDFLKL